MANRKKECVVRGLTFASKKEACKHFGVARNNALSLGSITRSNV